MSSNILVVLRGYIPLISIFAMLKIGKLPIIANYMQFYLKYISRRQKYGGFLLNCTKNPTDCFVLEVLTDDTASRFQNRILLNARRKKIKFYNSLIRNGSNYC